MSSPDLQPKSSLLVLTMLFESGLGILGITLAWLGSIRLQKLVWPADVPAAVGWGILATLPLLGLFACMLRSRWRPLLRLRAIVKKMVRLILPNASMWQIAAVSLAAGIGEELLFRGALQPWLVRYSNPATGLLLVSLLFGLVHAASWTYFWLATGIGLYLGGLSLWRGEILSAMVVHALYDFVALVCLLRQTEAPGPNRD